MFICKAFFALADARIRGRADFARRTAVAVLTSAAIDADLGLIEAHDTAGYVATIAVFDAADAKTDGGIGRGAHQGVGTTFSVFSRATGKAGILRGVTEATAIGATAIIVDHTFDTSADGQVIRGANKTSLTATAWCSAASFEASEGILAAKPTAIGSAAIVVRQTLDANASHWTIRGAVKATGAAIAVLASAAFAAGVGCGIADPTAIQTSAMRVGVAFRALADAGIQGRADLAQRTSVACLASATIDTDLAPIGAYHAAGCVATIAIAETSNAKAYRRIGRRA
jgi:hypothetical protein